MKTGKNNKRDNKSNNNKVLSQAELKHKADIKARTEANRIKQNKKKELTDNLVNLKNKHLSKETPNGLMLLGKYRNLMNIIIEGEGDPEKIKTNSDEKLETLYDSIHSLIVYEQTELIVEISTKYLGLNFLHRCTKDGQITIKTVAQIAAVYNKFPIFDLLVREKNVENLPSFDLNIKDSQGKSLLFYMAISLRNMPTNFHIENIFKQYFLANISEKECVDNILREISSKDMFAENSLLQKVKDLIDYFCDAGLDINSQCLEGRTILHAVLAVEYEEREKLEKFTKRPNPVKYADLVISESRKKIDFLTNIYRYLLSKGADDNIYGKIVTIESDNKGAERSKKMLVTASEIVKMLRDNKTDEMQKEKPKPKIMVKEKISNEKLLFKKVRKFKDNLPEIIEILSDIKESNFSEVDSKGCNIVHYAAWHGIYEIFSDIANKNNINEIDNHKMTPVMYAARNEKKTAIFELVRLGADITKENKFGETLMHYAASKGWIDVLKLAASNKKLLLTGNNEGYLPIHKAVVYDNMEVLKYLLKVGQDINVQASNGNTILHVAAQRGHMKIFNYLIEMGADQTIKNKSGILSGDPCPGSPIVTNLEEVKEISSPSSIVVDKKKDLTLSKI